VLIWIVERLDGQAAAMPSAIGNLPTRESFDVSGMDLDHRRRQRPRRMGSRGSAHRGSATFGAHLPAPLWDVYHA
jgi:phosphoenolpyruvate carboxykinase (GTP)